MSILSRSLGSVFRDQRLVAVLILGWIGCTVACMLVLNSSFVRKKTNDFFTIGPSKHTIFMGSPIDTWEQWGVVFSFCFTSSIINEFVEDSIKPWTQNTIQDHKNKTLPYSKTTCMIIMLIYTVYQHMAMIIFFMIYTTQIDFVLARLAADLIVTIFSTYIFMLEKEVEQGKEPPKILVEADILTPTVVIVETPLYKPPKSAPHIVGPWWSTSFTTTFMSSMMGSSVRSMKTVDLDGPFPGKSSSADSGYDVSPALQYTSNVQSPPQLSKKHVSFASRSASDMELPTEEECETGEGNHPHTQIFS